VTTLQAKEYAVERFQDHLDRFDRLVSLLEAESLTTEDMEYLEALRERDNPFSTIDYLDWIPRQGYAGQVPVASVG
jgi:predicted glycosyl hydrolase (DUF1957 family)